MSVAARRCRIVTSAILIAVPAAGAAQGTSPARRGAWFSGGVAYVAARQTAPYSGPHRLSGGALRLAAGWRMSRATRVGVGMTAPVARDADSQDEEIHVSPAVTALLRVYPPARAGLVLTGGLGVGGVRTLDEPGLALEAGLGYDVGLAPRLSLSPFVSVLRIGDRYRPTTYGHFGLAITLD